MVRERFRHRYELNNAYKTILEEAGLVFCGMTPDRRIMQILDYPTHPFLLLPSFILNCSRARSVHIHCSSSSYALRNATWRRSAWRAYGLHGYETGEHSGGGHTAAHA